nr:MAG TPA: carbohydrate esterase [Bacteriophage sp.]
MSFNKELSELLNRVESLEIWCQSAKDGVFVRPQTPSANVDLSNYFTKSQSDERYAKKGEISGGGAGEKGDKGDKGEPGEKGADGASAGFGTISAQVAQANELSVEVTATGENTAKNLNFVFKGLNNSTAQASAKSYEKFVIVGVWGQSNAVGYDESVATLYDVPKYENRLFQVSCRDDKLNIEPLTLCAKNIQNMESDVYRTDFTAQIKKSRAVFGLKDGRYTKGIHLPLANLIADSIPDDYGVLIVPGAYGGQSITNFLKSTTNSPGCAGGYYARFIKAIKKALEQGAQSDKNILAGIIWCQGEQDSGEMSGLAYKEKFNALINDVKTDLASFANRTAFSSLDKIWYCYEYPLHFKNQKYGRDILTAQKELLGISNYVKVDDNHPTNTATYTSAIKEAHYGQNYFRTHIAPSVFKKLKENGALLSAKISEPEYIAKSEYISKIDELSSTISILKSNLEILSGSSSTPKWRATKISDFERFIGTDKDIKISDTSIDFNAQHAGILLPENAKGVKYTADLVAQNKLLYIVTAIYQQKNISRALATEFDASFQYAWININANYDNKALQIKKADNSKLSKDELNAFFTHNGTFTLIFNDAKTEMTCTKDGSDAVLKLQLPRASGWINRLGFVGWTGFTSRGIKNLQILI